MVPLGEEPVQQQVAVVGHHGALCGRGGEGRGGGESDNGLNTTGWPSIGRPTSISQCGDNLRRQRSAHTAAKTRRWCWANFPASGDDSDDKTGHVPAVMLCEASNKEWSSPKMLATPDFRY